MKYKKIIPIVIALGMFTFGGVYYISKEKQKEQNEMKNYYQSFMKGNGELRRQIFKYLGNDTYSVNTDKCEITVMTEPEKIGIPPALVVIIKNKSTNDTIKIWDYYADGSLEKAEYNGIRGGLEGMEERFDQALEIIKPGLEQKVKKAEEEQNKIINKAKDNTKLK